MFRTLPENLKSINFAKPTDPKESKAQVLLGKGANPFEYIVTNSKLTRDFNDAMECHSKYNLTPWPEVYPTDSIVSEARPNVPLVVDVGGGKGHDLKKFLARHPEACKEPGSL